jgi:hypothetical protein
VTAIGLRREDYGTHSLRRTKASIIYKATGNLRAGQLLLGHTKIESTVRYLGVDVEDALSRRAHGGMKPGGLRVVARRPHPTQDRRRQRGHASPKAAMHRRSTSTALHQSWPLLALGGDRNNHRVVSSDTLK